MTFFRQEIIRGRDVRWVLPALLFCALLLLTGCAPDLANIRASGLPEQARIKGLQPFEQRARHCGPASLATLLLWAGRAEVTPDQLSPSLYTPGVEGTFLFDMDREARGRGLGAFALEGGIPSLFAELEAGHPVLALENRGLSFAPQYHFSVVGGYDLAEETFTLYEGHAFAVAKPMDDFFRSWKRTGYAARLVLPAGRLPVTGTGGTILPGLAALERAEHPGAAARGYEAYAARRPNDWRGHFGLANALHALGRNEAARAALERAAQADPSRPEPLNNLALLAFARGEEESARELAARAVAKAEAQGADPAPYRETLAEVSTGDGAEGNQ